MSSRGFPNAGSQDCFCFTAEMMVSVDILLNLDYDLGQIPTCCKAHLTKSSLICFSKLNPCKKVQVIKAKVQASHLSLSLTNGQ